MRRFEFWNVTTRVSAMTALSLALVLSACDDEPEEMDGGRDAAMAPDTGVMPDAGMDDAGMDAAVPPDGGADAGMPDGGPDAAAVADAGPIGGGAATSAQIQAVRDEVDGPTDLAIDDAIVTYTKTAIGSDPAGFFLQAEPMGPAIFVRVDPATLTPPAEVGQVVDLRVTDITTEQGRREVVAIGAGSWNVDSSGHDVGFLAQDISSVDIETMLDDYESELITVTFQPRGGYRAAGTGFQKISVDTAALPASVNLALRLPETLVSTVVFEPGCRYTLTATPMWRLTIEAQIQAFEASEITRADCDTPVVTFASVVNERTAVVRFNRTIDATSVMASGAQFTIIDSTLATITVTGATAVAGQDYVLVTTGADMLAPTFYTVTVASTVLDTAGTGIDAAMNEETFVGYTPHLVINEVDYDQAGTDAAEFIEIHNPGLTAVSLTGITLYTINGMAGTAVQAMVDLTTNSEGLTSLPAGGYIVVLTTASTGVTVPTGIATIDLASTLQNDAEGIVVRGMGAGGCHDAVFYEAVPTAATFMGCNYEAGAATDPGAGSLARIPNGADSGDNSIDFRLVATPTPGAANMP